MSYIFNLRKSQALIPELGQGLQKYNQEDDESIDPTNTLAIFEAEIWPEIKEYFGANKDVLDVGCGNGRFSAYLSDHAQSITAIDAFREMNTGHQRPNIAFVNQSLQAFEGQGYDVIFLFGVLYLQESWDTYDAFRKLVWKLKDNGVIISIDDKKRNVTHTGSKHLPAGYYNLEELCKLNNATVVKEFIQPNNIHRISVIKR
tara:strand:- start:30459 stop:31064 length:606 start_codon:yes stop_codon:yes gene_type:complete